MNATINGSVSGIDAGDALTIVEVLWKLRTSTGPDVFESESTAQTNGRGCIFTSYADRTALSAAMSAAGNPLSAGMTDSSIIYGSAGSSAITAFLGSGYAISSVYLVAGSTYTPVTRATESRGGSGVFMGGWTSFSPFTAPSNFGFVDTFTGSNGAAFDATIWSAPFASTPAAAAGFTANIQANSASISVAANSSTAYGGCVVKSRQVSFVVGNYAQVTFSGPAATNAYNRLYIVGENTTYNAYGDPVTNFIYVTYNTGGTINVCATNGAGSTAGEVAFGSAKSGAQIIKIAFPSTSTFQVFAGGTQQGSTTAMTVVFGSTIAMMLGLVTYGTTVKTYTFDAASVQ